MQKVRKNTRKCFACLKSAKTAKEKFKKTIKTDEEKRLNVNDNAKERRMRAGSPVEIEAKGRDLWERKESI